MRESGSPYPDMFKCIQQADCVTEVDLDRTKMQNNAVDNQNDFPSFCGTMNEMNKE